MPIKIPQDLPASDILEKEGVLLIKEHDAIRQDIRPLRILLLNLMPKKIETETQIARVLAGSPLQIEITLLAPSGHQPKNTSREHMLDFYRKWEDIKTEKFDGLIVTGAPIEQLPFEEVIYWDELCGIFDWSQKNVHGLFTLCWGAQAALYHFYKIPKYQLQQKMFGVFQHTVRPNPSILLHGLDDTFNTPVSRHTENRVEDFADFTNLEILVESEVSGLCLIQDVKRKHFHMFNHLEYDSDTLHNEYIRDLSNDQDVNIPLNYYPDNDPNKNPINSWRGNGHLLFSNWVNFLYQTTPFLLEDIGK